MIDCRKFLEGEQGLIELVFELGSTTEESLLLQDVHHDQAGDAGCGVARICVAVAEHEPGRVEKRSGDLRRCDDPAQGGVAAGDTLGECDQVRLETVLVGRKPVPYPSETGYDFVRDIEPTGIADQLLDCPEVGLFHRSDSTRPDDRLDEDPGDPLGTGMFYRLLHGFGIVVGDDHDVGHQVAAISGTIGLHPAQ